MNKPGQPCRGWRHVPFTLVTSVDSQAIARHVCEALLAQPAAGRPHTREWAQSRSACKVQVGRTTPADLYTRGRWWMAVIFIASLSCLTLHQSSCPGDFLLNILASSGSSPSALVPLSSSPLTWALRTEAQRQEGTAEGDRAEKHGAWHPDTRPHGHHCLLN